MVFHCCRACHIFAFKLEHRILTSLVSSRDGLSRISNARPLRSSAPSRNEEVVVYLGPLARQIRGVKFFSLLSSLSGLIAQPFILARAAELHTSTPVIVLVTTFIGFFTFVTPLLLHYITRKYVIRLTYNPLTDTYTATTISLFLRRKKIEFRPYDVVRPDVPGMFWSMTAKGVPLFVDSRYCEDIDHYKRMMGFNEPMDFKLKSND